MARCPRCDCKGASIGRATLEGQLPPKRLAGLSLLDGWCLCTSESCAVAYFRSEEIIVVDELRHPPFHKSDAPTRLVCFCFGHTVAAVDSDVEQHGASTIQASIKAECRAGRHDCERMNPQGRCCLGNVGLVMKRTAGVPSPHPSTNRDRSPEAQPEPQDGCCASKV